MASSDKPGFVLAQRTTADSSGSDDLSDMVRGVGKIVGSSATRYLTPSRSTTKMRVSPGLMAGVGLWLP